MQILFVAVVVAVAIWQVVAARRSGLPPRPVVTGFALWALAGLVATAALLTGLSIGVLLAPVAAILLGLAGRFAPRAAAACGVVAGAGIFLVLVAVRSDRPAGLDPWTWSLLGLGLVLAGVAGFALLPRRA